MRRPVSRLAEPRAVSGAGASANRSTLVSTSEPTRLAETSAVRRDFDAEDEEADAARPLLLVRRDFFTGQTGPVFRSVKRRPLSNSISFPDNIVHDVIPIHFDMNEPPLASLPKDRLLRAPSYNIRGRLPLRTWGGRGSHCARCSLTI